MKYRYFLFCLIFCSCLIPGDTPQGSPLYIMSWNVQNLFDAESDGTEYDEYNPELSDWNEAKMRIKLENIQEVLHSLPLGLPDILLLQEVENREVLEILNKEYLDGTYKFVDAWNDPGSAISTGILSRTIPENLHLHFPGKYGKYPLRPLVELHYRMEEEMIVIFNNHWKSRSGGRAATEEARIRAASMLADRIRELRGMGYTTIIAAGDFNGSVEDFRTGGSQTAMMPVDEIRSTAWGDSLYITSDEADFALTTEKVVLYSPWKQMDNPGTYFYQNHWMKLHHFLLDRGLFDDKGYDFSGCTLPVSSFMLDEDGHPAAWQSWRSAGYSDHFPLLLKLETQAEE